MGSRGLLLGLLFGAALVCGTSQLGASELQLVARRAAVLDGGGLHLPAVLTNPAPAAAAAAAVRRRQQAAAGPARFDVASALEAPAPGPAAPGASSATAFYNRSSGDGCLFGGLVAASGGGGAAVESDELWCYRADGLWEQVALLGAGPTAAAFSARSGAVGWYSAESGAAFVFGGRGRAAGGGAEPVGYLADLWRYDGSAVLMQNTAPGGWAARTDQLGAYGGGGGGVAWPGGRAMACAWHDESPRATEQMEVNNSDLEADAAAVAAIGFASMAPTGWGAAGTVVVVANGVFRWGAATSAPDGHYVNLLAAGAAISQTVGGLQPPGPSNRAGQMYKVSFRAASGFGPDEVLRVLVDGTELWRAPLGDVFAPHEFIFTAAASSAELTFENVSPAGGGGGGGAEAAVFVDDVQVDAVHIGTTYLFGGQGCDTEMCSAMALLSDLWWYTDNAGFRFVGGSTSKNAVGRYTGAQRRAPPHRLSSRSTHEQGGAGWGRVG